LLLLQLLLYIFVRYKERAGVTVDVDIGTERSRPPLSKEFAVPMQAKVRATSERTGRCAVRGGVCRAASCLVQK